ncbi:MAG: hypothetical protein GXO87_03385 [Chlorobi bacterium]|nr:hypothetical protein [Chlorobiota bacterium]
MKKLNEVLENKIQGLYYGNRVLLPFAAEVLKLIYRNDIITDFSWKKKGARYKIYDDYMEIYFCETEDLDREIEDYDVIKMVVVEKGEDLFDFKNHRRIDLRLLGKHKLAIEKVEDEMLFFE